MNNFIIDSMKIKLFKLKLNNLRIILIITNN